MIAICKFYLTDEWNNIKLSITWSFIYYAFISVKPIMLQCAIKDTIYELNWKFKVHFDADTWLRFAGWSNL